jgi:sarcosine oxidase, subunit alpha
VSRLGPQPGERVDRARPISFTFDGAPVSALEGDTIGSALHVSGRRTFSRSFKYHRRRGLMCCSGHCPNCLVAVDGAPGVRACTEPARAGARVEHLNALPRLELDAMAAVDVLGGPLTPPGFYYKTFIRPRRLWPAYEWLLRHAAGLGRLPVEQAGRKWRTEYRRRHADLLVVGAGLAGLSAANAAAELGADVVLVDEGPEPGGRALWEGGHERARALARRAGELEVELLSPAAGLGYYDGLLAVWQADTLHQVRARRHVYATGTIEQPLLFAGNDRPGVMLSGGAQRLSALYGAAPGHRAVLATTSDRGIEAALALHRAGVEIVAVADSRTTTSPLTGLLAEHGITTLRGWTAVATRGRREVSGVILGSSAGARASREFDCDLLLVSGGHVPADALVAQAGARSSYDHPQGHFRLEQLPPNVMAAGDLAGAGTADRAPASGELAGLLAARALGLGDARTDARCAELRERLNETRDPGAAVAPRPGPGRRRGRAFVCFCEDVSAKDVRRAVAEGYDSTELCKRFTTVTMGPCQGRMCQLGAIRLIAEATGQSLEQVGTTSARPPCSSVPLGVLAGRPFEPAKRSPIQGRHDELGATTQWAGDWQRPYHYGDPEGEALAVHRTAGLIDVSSLGKLLVRGPDAGAFLDRLYPNRLSSLRPGRVRYGVLTSDAGRIMDDGTVARLGEDTFYVTTTSGGAGAVEQWFAWWLADWQMDVHLSDITQALGAVNLAGPRARDILARLTDADCSPAGLAYLDSRQATVAGVPALLLRIGFVGELGYEIHFPAAFGEHLWDALLRAGASEGIRPFGLEPQRILRLQKQHIIVGQDTDSESTPHGAGMSWAVKLDKEEAFVGKSALVSLQQRPAESVLVGFSLGGERVPSEGAVILDAVGGAAGQVTSARRSRQLGKVIGLAWIPASLASDGTSITIADDGTRVVGSVVTEPFHDPAGELLRS